MDKKVYLSDEEKKMLETTFSAFESILPGFKGINLVDELTGTVEEYRRYMGEVIGEVKVEVKDVGGGNDKTR